LTLFHCVTEIKQRCYTSTRNTQDTNLYTWMGLWTGTIWSCTVWSS